MTATPPEPTPPTDPQPTPRPERFLGLRPRTWGIAGGVFVGLVGCGYLFGRYLIMRLAPPIVETVIEQYINWDAEVGAIETLSPTGLTVATTRLISPTGDDYAQVESLEIQYDLLGLLRRKLPVNIVANRPEAYVEQSEDGQWIDLEIFVPETKTELPIDIVADIEINDGLATVAPYAAEPIVATFGGDSNLLFGGEQILDYDVSAAIREAQFSAKGTSNLKTLQTDVEVTVDDFDLVTLDPLIPTELGIGISRGDINADLAIAVPSLENWRDTIIDGRAGLQNFIATSDLVEQPITADFVLGFRDTQARLQQGQIFVLGDLEMVIDGVVDWRNELAIDVVVLPFEVQEVLNLVEIASPVPLMGQFGATLQVRGPIIDPQITGEAGNRTPFQLDRLGFDTIQAEFAANLDTLDLTDLQVIPAAGGIVRAEGQMLTDFRALFEGKGDLDMLGKPFTLKTQGELPVEGLAAPYYEVPDVVDIASLTFAGQGKGTLRDVDAELSWTLPPGDPAVLETISGSGKVIYRNNELRLSDTELVTRTGGKIDLGNQELLSLANQTWQVSVDVDQLNLDLFLPDLTGTPVNLPSELEVVDGEILLAGTFDALTDYEQISGNVDLQVRLNGGNVDINTVLGQGQINAQILAGAIALGPLLKPVDQPIDLRQARVDVTVPLAALLDPRVENVNLITGDLSAQVVTNTGNVDVNGELLNGQFGGVATVNNLVLSELVPQVPIFARIDRVEGQIAGDIQPLLAIRSLEDIEAAIANVQGSTDGQITTTGGTATFTGSLIDNQIRGQGQASNLDLGWILTTYVSPDYDLRLGLEQGAGQFEASVPTLLALLNDPTNLSGIFASGRGQLIVDGGTVIADGRLAGNLWETEILVNGIQPVTLGETFVPTVLDWSVVEIAPVDARLALAGELLITNPLDISTTVAARSIRVDTEGQSLQVRGNLALVDLLSRPDVTGVNLTVKADSDLYALPVQSILDGIPNAPLLAELSVNSPPSFLETGLKDSELVAIADPADKENTSMTALLIQALVPTKLKIEGNATFSGQLRANNLLTDPLNDLALTGNTVLSNFRFNDRPFEPKLQGPLEAIPNRNIALRLQGTQDAIAAGIEPCDRGEACLLPYLPTGVELRQEFNTDLPIVVTGDRNGDVFNLAIEDFYLEILGIAPGTPFGIPGLLTGDVQATAQVNLFDLNSRGELTLLEPGVGVIKANKIAGKGSYQDGLAEVTEGLLTFGDVSELTLDFARFNLNTQELGAKADGSGNLNDIFVTLNIADLEGLLDLAMRTKFADATVLATESLGAPPETITHLLNTLYDAERRIRARALAIRQGSLDLQLALDGNYTLGLVADGTLSDPRADFNFLGDSWYWQARPQYPNVIAPLGLVIEDPQTIAINRLKIDAGYADRVARLDEFEVVINRDGVIQVQDAQLALNDFVLDQMTVDAKFSVSQFPLDFIQNFVTLPIDVDGSINVAGELGGLLFNPKVDGTFAFEEGVINGQDIGDSITATFSLQNWLAKAETTGPDYIQLDASLPVPVPMADLSQPARFDLVLTEDAIALIDPLSKGQLVYVEGAGRVEIKGSLPLNQGLDVETLISLAELNGEATFDAASFVLPALPGGPILVDGSANFNAQQVDIESLTATFAEAIIGVSGSLPLLNESLTIEQPLTASFQNGTVNLKGLYTGGLTGDVMVKGTAIKPVISGDVTVASGKVSIPVPDKQKTVTDFDLTEQQRKVVKLAPPVETTTFCQNRDAHLSDPKIRFAFIPCLENFTANVGPDFQISQRALFKFVPEGQLVVNGPALEFRKYEPTGTILLNRGQITFFDIAFNLTRLQENVVVFEPQYGVLNPRLDMIFVSLLVEPDTALANRPGFSRNEIEDDLFQGSRSQTIRVNLALDGQASQIIPALAAPAPPCKVKPDALPLLDKYVLNADSLENLSDCISRAVYAQKSDDDLPFAINSPALKFTSSPQRSEGEIINLLGSQFIALAEQFQDATGEELVQIGIGQFVITPLLRDALFGFQEATHKFGKNIGLADFQLLPNAEATYGLAPDSYLILRYDYFSQEALLNFESRF
ncbi:MAG: translocation/assembly module TamB domain-containing protein [Cyanobacteria bacterium P01_H01_bin.15]